MTAIGAYFTRHDWTAEEVEPGIWRSSFATEAEEDFDLYVLVADDWAHFVVSPFLARFEGADMTRLYAILLRLNQELRLARFALDGDGDVNLLADLHLSMLSYVTFSRVIELIVACTDRLAGELRRVAREPGYHSPLFE
jgi:hypothetical protein